MSPEGPQKELQRLGSAWAVFGTQGVQLNCFLYNASLPGASFAADTAGGTDMGLHTLPEGILMRVNAKCLPY